MFFIVGGNFGGGIVCSGVYYVYVEFKGLWGNWLMGSWI